MILGIRLRLREGKRLSFGVAPHSRAVFGLLFCLSLYVLLFGVLFAGESTVFRVDNAVPWLLVFATAFALLYEERWIFDRERGTVEGRFGILFLNRRRTMAIRDLRAVRVAAFRRGGVPDSAAASEGKPRTWRTVARLTVEDAGGEAVVLDTANGLRIEDLRRAGKRIAAYCGLPFTDG